MTKRKICDQIGQYFLSLGKKYAFKISPNIKRLSEIFGKKPNKVKTTMATFLGNFGKNWTISLFENLVTLMVSHAFSNGSHTNIS